MEIADPEAALEKLREFRDLQETARKYPFGEAPLEIVTAITHLVPLVEEIARSLGEEQRIKKTGGWPYTVNVTNRLISIVEQRDDYQRIFGPAGPSLATGGLHPWVWHAVVNLWDGEHHKQAVNAAASAVEEQTQLKLDRGNLSGAPLYTQAFKVDKVGVKPDGPRLRFPHLEELTSDGKRNQDWTSAHQGAMNFGQGCALGIRNLNAHGTGELPEQEALEYLAALSVLARWVEQCKPDPEASDGAASAA